MAVLLRTILIELLNCARVKDLFVLSNQLSDLCLGLVEVKRVISWHVLESFHSKFNIMRLLLATSAAAFTVTQESCYRRTHTLTLGSGESLKSTVSDLLALEPTDGWRVAKISLCGSSSFDFSGMTLWFADYESLADGETPSVFTGSV